MPTYADELRRLADLLDKDWNNRIKVAQELESIADDLCSQALKG